ncbi:MAG: sensor domain-containing protein [Actinomycetales bacterium]
MSVTTANGVRAARVWTGPELRVTLLRTLHLLADLVLGPVVFSLAVTAVAASAGLAVTVVGTPLLVLTLLAARGLASLERKRLGVLLAATPRPAAATPVGFWRKLADAEAWRAVLYLVLLLPVGTVTGTLALTVWSLALGGVGYPLYAPFLGDAAVHVGSWTLSGVPAALLAVAVGVAAALVAPTVLRWLAALDLALARACRLVR